MIILNKFVDVMEVIRIKVVAFYAEVSLNKFGEELRFVSVKLQLHDAIYRLRFYSNSLIDILSLSNSHNNVASIQESGR